MMKRIRNWLILAAALLFVSSYVAFNIVAAEEGNDESEAVEEDETSENEAEANNDASANEEAVEDEDVDDATDEEEVDTVAGEEELDTPFPQDDDFRQVAENEFLILKVDDDTGHFMVRDKRTDILHRSFPNPDHWQYETVSETETWGYNLVSPMMFRYVQFDVRESQANTTSFAQQNGEIVDFEEIEGGFRLTFDMPNMGIAIPIEVRIDDDFIETRVIDEGIVDEGLASYVDDVLEELGYEDEAELLEAQANEELSDEELEMWENTPDVNSLVSVRLYPFFGAAHSLGQEGYLVVPDGSGALINFAQNRAVTTTYYNEKVYGEDIVFAHTQGGTHRKYATMPIFGLKSANQAFLGVIHEGEEYANVVAAPSGSFSLYNWATADFAYRSTYFQPTTTDGREGFNTYTEDRFNEDRSVRYYLMDEGKDNYVGMAERYRQYLMDEKDVQPVEATDDDIPLHLTIVGGDTEQGFFWDSYLPLTTTAEAIDIVSELNGLGIENMSVVYKGWQRNGYSSYGGHFPVDRRIGGNDGMQEFINFVQGDLGFPVYFEGQSYSYNTSFRDGFIRQRDGLRDLGGTIVDFTDWVTDDEYTLVSTRFMQRVIDRDLPEFADLGVNGISFGGSIGQFLNSDYNNRHFTTRTEGRQILEEIFASTKDELGSVRVQQGSAFTLPYIDHMDLMYSDYSYDIFSDDVIPFKQIATHGLITYSFTYGNLRDDYMNDFLRNIEYGAHPAFIVTDAQSHELILTANANYYYSTHYADWAEEMLQSYQQHNEALKDVQGEFIVDHQTLARGVRETTYSNGQRVIVNFNNYAYLDGDIRVDAQDFLVIPGGE